jgi:hypothetical protein
MALHGSMTVLKAKHTWGFNLGDRINNGLQKWEKDVAIFRQKILNLSERNSPILRHKHCSLKACTTAIITFQTFKAAYDLYFERAVRMPEEYPDSAPRTAWGLHNALTRALKVSTPNVQFNGTIAVSRELGLA